MIVNILFDDDPRTAFFLGDLPASLKKQISSDKKEIYSAAKQALFVTSDRNRVDVRRKYDGETYVLTCSLGSITATAEENQPVQDLWILGIEKEGT